MQNPVNSQLAQRDLVRQAKRRAIVTSATYSKGGMRARVFIDGEYYDVDEHRLDKLVDGRTPSELELTPIADDALDANA